MVPALFHFVEFLSWPSPLRHIYKNGVISRLSTTTINGLHNIDKVQKTLLQETRKLVLQRDFEAIIASILVNK